MTLVVTLIDFLSPLSVMSTQVVGISFPKELIKKIDSERGDVPRSKYIVRSLEKVYGAIEESSKK